MEGHIIALFLVFFTITMVLGVLTLDRGINLLRSLEKQITAESGTDAVLLVFYSVLFTLSLSAAVYLYISLIKGFLA